MKDRFNRPEPDKASTNSHKLRISNCESCFLVSVLRLLDFFLLTPCFAPDLFSTESVTKSKRWKTHSRVWIHDWKTWFRSMSAHKYLPYRFMRGKARAAPCCTGKHRRHCLLPVFFTPAPPLLATSSFLLLLASLLLLVRHLLLEAMHLLLVASCYY